MWHADRRTLRVAVAVAELSQAAGALGGAATDAQTPAPQPAIFRQMANDGENMQEISAGKYKTMGAYWKPLTSEEKAIIQGQVNKIYAQFKDAVQLHREIAAEYMEGQTFDGAEAAEIGLVDGGADSLDEILS